MIQRLNTLILLSVFIRADLMLKQGALYMEEMADISDYPPMLLWTVMMVTYHLTPFYARLLKEKVIEKLIVQVYISLFWTALAISPNWSQEEYQNIGSWIIVTFEVTFINLQSRDTNIFVATLK